MDDNKIIVLVGHSGCGKDTLARMLCKHLGYEFIVSHTTRPMRNGESEGDPYYFISDDTFKGMMNQMIEHRAYHTSVNNIPETWYYGVHEDTVDLSKNGYVVVLDVIGLQDFKKHFGDKVVSFFINVPEPIRRERVTLRGDFDECEWVRRWEDDKKIFTTDFLKSGVDFLLEYKGDEKPMFILSEIIRYLEGGKKLYLLEKNINLIHAIIHKHRYYTVDDYDEVFQAGLYGLWRATEVYDESKNVKFSTYATTTIRHHILNHLSNMQLNKNKVNLESWSFDFEYEDGSTLHETVACAKREQQQYKDLVDVFIDWVDNDLDRKIIYDHYIVGKSFREIGAEMNLSGQRIFNRVQKHIKKAQECNLLVDKL